MRIEDIEYQAEGLSLVGHLAVDRDRPGPSTRHPGLPRGPRPRRARQEQGRASGRPRPRRLRPRLPRRRASPSPWIR